MESGEEQTLNFIQKSKQLCKAYSVAYSAKSRRWNYILMTIQSLHAISSVMIMVTSTMDASSDLKKYLGLGIGVIGAIITGIDQQITPGQYKKMAEAASDAYKQIGGEFQLLELITDEDSDEYQNKIRTLQEKLVDLSTKYDEPNPDDVAHAYQKIKSGVWNLI